MKKFLRLRGGKGDDDTDVFAKVKEEIAPAVVTIEITHPRNFGLDIASSTQATGYIVDKEQGIICSNKHVVHEGPCRAKARFMKHEEIDLLPLYRDPVHDFGFFKFDPSMLKETPLVEIELDPDGAKRGRNALIIGNNGGEKLSFVPTTVSRTDRMAVVPLDMNTFYITASDTSVGGSSGAPLLSSEGKAIAMMAAGSDRTNISLYLPLPRVARALEYLRKGSDVPRGTIQVGFKYQTFDALLKRNAVTEDHVSHVKKEHSESEGMLIVERTVPKGPGKLGGLRNGDVLFQMNGRVVCNYVDFEEVLDTFIGKEISISVVREQAEVEIKSMVQDQSDIEVNRFVEVSNGIFHETQYKVAAAVNLPIEGVFVAKSGYMFRDVPFASIIKRIGKHKIDNIEDFFKAIQSLDNAALVSVRYQPIQDQNKIEIAIITVDKRWYPFELATRNDKNGCWDYIDLNISSKRADSLPAKPAIPPVIAVGDNAISELEKYCSSLVEVKYTIPFSVDGGYDIGTTGIGIIVDAELGLVLASRDAIATTLADVQLIFNKSKTVFAKVLFIHPETPVTLVKYDPSLLDGDSTAEAVQADFSQDKPAIGEKLDYVGITNNFELKIDEVKVTNFRDVDFLGGEMLGHQMASAPNEYVGFNSGSVSIGIYLDQNTHLVKGYSLTGIEGSGRARLAIDALPIIESVRASIKTGTPMMPNVHLLPITTAFIDLSEARINSLPDEWAYKLQQSMTLYQKKLIVVKRRMVNSDAYAKLLENDIILAVDGVVVTLIREFYSLLRGKNQVKLQLLRDDDEIELNVETTAFSTVGTSRILHFGGLILQDPHPAIFFLSTPKIIGEGGVYVTFQEGGSPASTSELAHDDRSVQSRIVQKLVFKVNGVDVTNLEEFKKVVVQTKHEEFVRLVAKDITRGEESIHDIRLDLEYWKTRDMFLDENGDWVSQYIEHAT